MAATTLTFDRDSDQATLAAFVLGAGEPPPAGVLRRSGLAAHAYATLSAEHPARAALRADYLAALVRHREVKEALLSLLAAWQAAGVRALLFGGFVLAEFVYAAPGTRHYDAVDVLLRPEALSTARRLAREHGWSVVAARRGLAFALHAPAGQARVAVWRSPVRGLLLWGSAPWDRVPARIGAAAWSGSLEHAWEDVAVRTMRPCDELLIALVLRRCWGATAWRVEPLDAVDVRQLGDRFGLGAAEVRERARTLGCARTLDAFLDRCDPAAGRLDLARPGPAAWWRGRRAALYERIAGGRAATDS